MRTDGWTANGDNYKCHLAVSGDTNVYAGFNAVAASQMTVLVNSIGGASKCQVIDANLSCPVVGDVSYTACTSSYVVAQDKQLCVTDGNDASAHVELNTASSFCAGQTFMGKLCDVPYTDNNPKTVVMVYAAEPTLTINAPANSWTLYEGGACTGTAITNLQHPTGTQLCVKAGTVAGATFDPSDGCNSGAWTQMGMGEDYTCNVTMAANSAVTLNFIGTGTLAVTTNLTGEPLPDYYEVFNGACGTENPGNSCTLIMSAAGNNEVRANYSLKPMLNFSSTCSPELTGGVCTAPTVTVGGTALTSGSYIATDSTVSAAANAPENYEFLPANNANTCNGGVWTGNAADGYTCSFTATGKESYSITPVYSQKPNVTAEAVCSPALSEGTCGTLTSETTGYQATGTSITVTAAATGNYEFLPANNGTTCNGGAWTKPENSDYTCTFVANANATNSVRPVFTQKPKLTLVQRPSSSATFYDCTGEEASAISETELYYATGTSVSICVTTGAGYTFNDSASTCPDGSWTDSGTMKKCSVTMNGDKSIVVVSDAQNAGALYVSSEGTGAGSLQCAVGTYKYYNGWGENNVSTSNLTCPPDGSSYSSCDASYILNSTTGPSYGWNNSQNSYKKSWLRTLSLIWRTASVPVPRRTSGQL